MLRDINTPKKKIFHKDLKNKKMIISLALALLSLIGGFISILLIRDLIWYLRSLKYIKQGIPVRYFPVLGYARYFDNPDKDHCLYYFYQLFKTPRDENQTEELILMNGTGAQPTIFLNDKDLVNEFHKKETQVSYMHNLFGFPADNSFSFSKDPHRVQRDRRIFVELFFPKNLEKNTPQIRAIVQRHLSRVKDEIKRRGTEVNKEGRKEAEIELKPFIKQIFTEMVSFILFGGEIPEVDGILVIDQIIAVINSFFKNATSPLHMASFGLSTKLGLDSEYNQAHELYQKIMNKIKEVVRERENTKGYQFGSNAVDLLILKNRSLKAQGKAGEVMNDDQIAANIFSIIFGGIDTSRNLTESALYKLSMEPELQSRLRETVRNQVLDTGDGEEYAKYDNSPLLDAFIKESLRLYSPITFTLHRKVTKNFKVGKYTIYKGDLVTLSLATLQMKPELFENPKKFDLGKYEQKKRIKDLSRSALIPFSAGKRECLGKNLADLMIKLILCNVLDQFELRKTDEPNRRDLEFTLGLRHCKLRMSCLQ